MPRIILMYLRWKASSRLECLIRRLQHSDPKRGQTVRKYAYLVDYPVGDKIQVFV